MNRRTLITRKSIGIFFVLLVGIIVGYAYYYAISSPLKISSADAKELIKRKRVDVILDVRTDVERKTLGFYPGSVHVPAGDLETKFVPNHPDKNIQILAYCNTGQRARKAAEKLTGLGYKNVRYIVGSYTTLY